MVKLDQIELKQCTSTKRVVLEPPISEFFYLFAFSPWVAFLKLLWSLGVPWNCPFWKNMSNELPKRDSLERFPVRENPLGYDCVNIECTTNDIK